MGKSETPFSLYATERVQKKDARVHFYTEQVKGLKQSPMVSKNP
jgi:hypothetical protein